MFISRIDFWATCLVIVGVVAFVIGLVMLFIPIGWTQIMGAILVLAVVFTAGIISIKANRHPF